MGKIVLNAEFREDAGKGASRRLRRAGKVPAVLYGGGKDPKALSLEHDPLLHHLENEAFYSSVLTLRVDKRAQPAILKDVQRHPAKPQVLHLDLQRILEDEEIRMLIPLHFVGEDVAPGVKQGGTVAHTVTEVELLCLPKDLPEYIDVDVSEVELDGVVKLSELVMPEGTRLASPPTEDNDPAVLSIRVVRVQVEVEEVEEGEEVPVEGVAEPEAAAEAPKEEPDSD